MSLGVLQGFCQNRVKFSVSVLFSLEIKLPVYLVLVSLNRDGCCWIGCSDWLSLRPAAVSGIGVVCFPRALLTRGCQEPIQSYQDLEG